MSSAAENNGHVTAEGLGKTYRSTRSEVLAALKDVTFSVRREEFVSIVGVSGCGKSTLLSIIAGLVPGSTGTVMVNRIPVEKPDTDIGIVFQDSLLLEWRTALANIMLQVEIRNLDAALHKRKARELMASVGLSGFENKYPYELSGGMRQRVSICRALIHEPALLLMDEPFGALDAITREQLTLDLQALWSRSKKTVIFVTHSIQEAVFLSDRVIVMSPRPGTVVDIVDIDLPRLRTMDMVSTPEFGMYARQIRDMLNLQQAAAPA